MTSRAVKPDGNVSEVPPHAWHTLGTDLFYWNKMEYILVGDYFSKFLLVRKIPNTSTHIGDQGTGNDLVLHFQGVPRLPRILQSSPYHEQPTSSTKQWIC